MRKTKDSADNPKPARREPTEAEVEALLDQMDAALLSGDTTRVQELVGHLWAARRRVPEVLMRRIGQNRARIPAFAFELLGGFAGSRAVGMLKRIADDRSVPDIVRFGARRRAGWPEKGQAKRRLAFLDTLEDADGTLALAVGQGTMTWPPEGEILAEVLGYLWVLPSQRRQTLIARFASELGARAAWLLHAALHLPDPSTQMLVLKELVRLHQPASAGPIARLARTAPEPAIRAEAAAAAQRLRVRPVDSRVQPELPPLPPVERALLSLIDGDGGQVAIVLRRWSESLFTFADIFANDHLGIKDAFGSAHAQAEQVQEIVGGLEDAGVRLVEVDPAAVRAVLSAAVAANAAAGHGIPPAFELWEPLVHDSYPPPEGEATAIVALDDAPYARRQDLVRASAQLAEHPFFESWGFEPEEVLLAVLTAPPPSGSRLTDRQYRLLIQQLANRDVCARLRQRLCRQAWLLEKIGDVAARDIALAVAAQFASARTAELVAQPFLRALVGRSLQHVLEEMLPFEYGPAVRPADDSLPT